MISSKVSQNIVRYKAQLFFFFVKMFFILNITKNLHRIIIIHHDEKSRLIIGDILIKQHIIKERPLIYH